MKIVGIPLCAASLAVYVVFLGFDNMDQVHASGPHRDECERLTFTMAEYDCKNRKRSLFTLSDLKTSTGSCQTMRRLPTKGSANKTDDDLKFRSINCDDQHHYVCKQNATNSDMAPQYHPACYEKTSSHSGLPVVYTLVIATVCLVIALAIGIIAVYVIIQRKTNVKDSGTPSQAGDAQHTGSNLDNGCGLETDGTEAANHRLTAVEFHGPVDAEGESAVVIVQCKDSSDVDSLEASPSDVTY